MKSLLFFTAVLETDNVAEIAGRALIKLLENKRGQCPVCYRVFPSVQDVRSHFNIVHMARHACNPSANKPYLLLICHLDTPLIRDFCGKSVSSSRYGFKSVKTRRFRW